MVFGIFLGGNDFKRISKGKKVRKISGNMVDAVRPEDLVRFRFLCWMSLQPPNLVA